VARRLRLQIAGGFYHLLCRGNRGQPVFHDDLDRQVFLSTLGECCAKTRWRTHAFCLLPDHLHLLVETPVANLVLGMKWLLGTYTVRFNRRHLQRGHLFQGRYHSSHVGPSGGFLAQVADYVHLNPVRAGLIAPAAPLKGYAWSSFKSYLEPAMRPPWLCVAVVLKDCGRLADDPHGRLTYEQHVEVSRESGELAETFNRIRKDWCFGPDTHRKRLLAELELQHGKGAGFSSQTREAAELKADQLIRAELKAMGATVAMLASWRKGDSRKLQIARRLRAETTMTYGWIAGRLHMGARSHLVHLLYWEQRRRTKCEETPRPRAKRGPRAREATPSILTSDPTPALSLEEWDPRFD